MPKIDASLADLQQLIGRRAVGSELEDLLLYAKTELDAQDGDALKLDVKDTNRPDLWSVEGVAREILLHLGHAHAVVAKPSGLEVRVDPSAHFRPVISCFTADLDVTEALLVQLIQSQEKLADVFGRRRAALSIGVYNRAAIQGPIAYRAEPGLRFAPLGFTERMTAKEILERHPKGHYGSIHAGEPPLALIDASGAVLSYVPVINSNDAGRVEPGHSQLFIEGTGTDQRLVETAMQAMAASLALRGAKIGSVLIRPAHGPAFETPDLAPRAVSIDPVAVRAAAGLELPDAELRALLQRSGYAVTKAAAKRWDLAAPFYRNDLMHWRDVAEDALISYGYNRIEPLPLVVSSTGALHPLTKLEDRAAAAMTGLGFQEVLSYTLTNRDALFERMQLPPHPVVEIANPVSATWAVFRTSLLPGLLAALAQNQHREYPQRLFEAGTVIIPDPHAETRARDERRLAAAVADSRINYADLLAAALALCKEFGRAPVAVAHEDPRFVAGRSAALQLDGKTIGVLGELSPRALTAWGLNFPAAAFELRLEALE